MSRLFTSVAGYLAQSSAAVSDVPLTMACWFLPDTYVSVTHNLMMCGASRVSANDAHWLQVSNTTGNLSAASRRASTVFAQVTNFVGPAIWRHAAGVWASSTSRRAFINGVGGTENTTSVVPTTPFAATVVGAFAGIGNVTQGRIALPAIWNVALTPAEIARLAAGASPLSIRRENLVRYWPHLGSRERELCVVSGTELVATNATPHADEPRIWTPKRRIWVPVAGGQTVETGISAETDSAFGLTWRKTKAAGLNTETDSGFAVARAKRKAVGLNTETDSGFALARRKVKIAGLNTETDSAFATAKAKRYAAGLNTETDTALSVSGSQAILVGIAEAIDTALAVTKRIAKAVGLTTETDSALPVVNATIVAVGQAQETDSAFSVAKLKRKLVGLAREYDTSRKLVQNITVSWGLNFPLIRPMVRNLIQSWRSRRFPWKEPF